MTVTVCEPTPPRVRQPRPLRLGAKLRDVAVMAQRNLVHIRREPLQLSDVTIQPALFTLLFVYILGAGVVLPGGGTYVDFAIAGLLGMNVTTSSMGTGRAEHRPQHRGDRPLSNAADVASSGARRTVRH